MAEGAERPPDARRADDATRVVDDDAIGVRDPQPADALRELPRAREHVRQGRAQVGDLVDVEERGAGDVRLDELLEGLEPKPSHVPRAVDDAQVAAAEIRDEPPGRDERFFFQAKDGIRDKLVTGVQTCALPISSTPPAACTPAASRAAPATPPKA